MREPEEIDVQDLEFDEVNIQHLTDHSVTPAQLFEVLANAPQFFRNLPDRAASHVMLGPDASRRFFYAALRFTGRPGLWRPVTAYRYDRRRALRYYRQEGT